MANLCYFEAVITGKKDNCKSFLSALQQEGKAWIGRGAFDISIVSDDELDKTIQRIAFSADCKWSIRSALIDNALSMRADPSGWFFGDRDPSEIKFLTIDEACSFFNVSFEAYSEEYGVGFQEHILINDKGDILTDECEDACEYFLEDFETKKEAEEEYDKPFSDEEFREGWCVRGGFEEWIFEL